MKVITVGGVKGGSGKTTLATNLTVLFAQEFKDVLLVDADNQGTASDFTAAREETLGDTEYTCIQLEGKSISREVKKLVNNYDWIVIDTGGRDTSDQRHALIASDIYLVPFSPRAYDVWTMGQVEDIISEIESVNPDLVPLSVINRSDPAGGANIKAMKALEQSEIIKHFDTPIGNRIAFAHSSEQGLAVTEYKPEDTKANAEITKLYNFIKQL